MRETEQKTRRGRPAEGAHPARLVALLAGAGLSLLGVLGFFYDASFGTGEELGNDDLAGILLVNGWRDLIYIVSGLLALALASRRPRGVALGLGAFYLLFAIWGLAATDHGVGSILDALPLGDHDNLLHLLIGILGLLAALLDGGLQKPRRSWLEGSPARKLRGRLRGARADRRRPRGAPPGAAGGEPR